jgi:lysylphosphatidylglycerol synthetase-like protein (DUF2156 family)
MIETATKKAPVEAGREVRPSGPAMAMILSAAVGVFVIGLATVLASASPSVKDALNWWAPGGPLTGKTGVGVIAWLVTWMALHGAWRKREVAFRGVWTAAVVLVVLGLVLTFPPVFEAFEPHK